MGFMPEPLTLRMSDVGEFVGVNLTTILALFPIKRELCFLSGPPRPRPFPHWARVSVVLRAGSRFLYFCPGQRAVQRALWFMRPGSAPRPVPAAPLRRRGRPTRCLCQR